MIKSAHSYISEHARNWAFKQKKIGTHTYLRRYVNKM